MDKEHEYYLKLYEDAYRNRIDDPKYNCVKKYLHKIIKHYYLKIKDVYYEPELNMFKQILDCFDKLIEENNFNYLDNNINYLFLINKYSVGFGEQLYTLMSPHNDYQTKKDQYISRIYDCFYFYENMYRDRECNKNSGSRIQNIVECYMKYVRMLPNIYGTHEISMVAYVVGALFYLTDKDINYLDDLYEYLFDNYEEIKNSFTLNSSEVETNYYLGIANFIINFKIEQPKKLIK